MLFKKIAIIGVGLLGGSIGLGVRKRNLAEEIIGIGRNESSLQKALKRGAVDEITMSISKVRDADLIIPATPVKSIPQIVKGLFPFAKKGAIINDVGSTKLEIVREIEKITPLGVHFVGGHPLAGSEKKGVEFADSDLFEGSICFLTPLKMEREGEAVKLLEKFWRALGAKPAIISPQVHDFLVAGISHLPHLVAVSLVNAILPMKLESKRLIEFAGQGWKDTTRISKGSPELWIDILSTNREEILRFIEKFDEEWDKIKNFLEEEKWEELKRALSRATEHT